jgi:hypothetical protein
MDLLWCPLEPRELCATKVSLSFLEYLIGKIIFIDKTREMNTDVQRCAKMSKDVQRCPKMNTDVQRCAKMYKDVQRCAKMSKDVQRCTKMSKDEHRCTKMCKDVQRCAKMYNKKGNFVLQKSPYLFWNILSVRSSLLIKQER